MNSDFYFGDLKTWKLAENKNKLLGETEKAYIVESVFHKAWFNQRLKIKINKKTFLIEEVNYFTDGCELPVRTMKIIDKKELQGYTIPIHIEMTSFKNCSRKIISSSEIIYIDWNINAKINEMYFTQEYMTYPEF